MPLSAWSVGENDARRKQVLPSADRKRPFTLGDQLDREVGEVLAIDDVVGSHPLHTATNDLQFRSRIGIQTQKEASFFGDLPRNELGKQIAGLAGAHANRLTIDMQKQSLAIQITDNSANI